MVIDEALELARAFSSEEAVPFVNGVLDARPADVAGDMTHEATDDGLRTRTTGLYVLQALQPQPVSP